MDLFRQLFNDTAAAATEPPVRIAAVSSLRSTLGYYLSTNLYADALLGLLMVTLLVLLVRMSCRHVLRSCADAGRLIEIVSTFCPRVLLIIWLLVAIAAIYVVLCDIYALSLTEFPEVHEGASTALVVVQQRTVELGKSVWQSAWRRAK